MATGAMIGSAVLGAYNANQQRQAQAAGSSSTTQPWSSQVPHLEQGFDEAQRLYESGGPGYFPNAGYTPFSPQTEQGLGMIENRALAGSPLLDSAQGYAQGMMSDPTGTNALRDTAGGNYLNSNPHLDAAYGNAADRMTQSFQEGVMPSLNATFGAAGRTGSPAHSMTATNAAGELGDSLSDLSSSIYGGNYQAERDRMLNAGGALAGQEFGAARMAPGLAEQDYNDANRMLGVGGAVEGQAQQQLQDQMNRFNFNQNRPEDNLSQYMSFINGNYGGTTRNTGVPTANPLTGALGGAMAGSQLFGAFGGGAPAFGEGGSVSDPFFNASSGYDRWAGDPFS